MRIEIKTRLAPFSHRPGTRCLIPGTTWEAEVFPALIRLKNLAGKEIYELSLSHKGPVKGFTVQQDLEKRELRIFGRAENGYFRSFMQRRGEKLFFDDEELPPTLFADSPLENRERLSLGITKQQNWDYMLERLDPCELWPFWLRLAQQTPKIPLQKVGSYCLLAACETASKVDLIRLWRSVFMGCFEGMLSPRLQDEKHQGLFQETPLPPDASPIGLLHEGARLIRSLFFLEEARIHLLPNLPPQCHAGRFIGLQTSRRDRFDLEWSKKILKKVVICPTFTGELPLTLQKSIRHFRLRDSLKERGKQILRDTPIPCRAGEKLYLDRFS